jgi:hypothetical protein
VNIYIGFDPREEEAYHVALNSIVRRATLPLTIDALRLEYLGHVFNRPIERRDGKLWCPISQAPMATEFAISRFCVPFLQKEGWALFIDSDVVCLADIAELFELADERYAVMCVKHSQAVKEGETKMDGQVQTFYLRKNWSSVMLFNCSHPANQRLTSEALNTWPGRDLHAFKWLEDSEIGELPQEWNWLVGATPGDESKAKLLHYTLGGPFLFPNWRGGPLDYIWLSERESMTSNVR